MKWIVIFLLMVAIAFDSFQMGGGCRRKKAQPPAVQYVNALTDTVTHYKDLYKAEHGRVLAEVNSRAAIEALHRQQMDSLCRRNGILHKQLQAWQHVELQDNGSFTAPLQSVTTTPVSDDAGDGYDMPRDSVEAAKAFTWHDRYLQETGLVTADSVRITYHIAVPVTTSSYWRWKHHFFALRWPVLRRLLNSRQYFFDAYSDNPNISITGLQAVKINDK